MSLIHWSLIGGGEGRGLCKWNFNMLDFVGPQYLNISVEI
jgi:hypothetical protein